MTFTEIGEILLKGLGILGGTAVVIGGMAAFFGKFFADRAVANHKATLDIQVERVKSELNRETERLKAELSKDAEVHKLKLKKSEILFEKELQAAKDFFALEKQIRPPYSHPDMDWDEAMERVVENLGDTEAKLQSFRIAHGPILSRKVRELLDSCIETASDDKFTAHDPFSSGDMKAAKKRASDLLGALAKIEEQLVDELRA